MNPRKIVAFTGAGISAPSGLSTFRSAGGLWEKHRIEDVATPRAWARDPELVLRFYNARRAALASVTPNAAHRALAALEKRFEVVVITQNVDDLHERAGSTQVIHIHGELRKVRSTRDPDFVIDVGYAPVSLGQLCPQGGQLRPHVVWFEEDVMHFDTARHHVAEAARFLVVGTSLRVFPAAGLVDDAQLQAEKVLVDLEPAEAPDGFQVLKGSADILLPEVAARWLQLP